MTKEDYYNRFVVIVTTKDLYDAYRQLYPHFIIIIQPNTSFQCVGLTRHTELLISIKCMLKKIACIDDNIINILMGNFDYNTAKSNEFYNSYYLNKLTILEDLFKLDKIKLDNLNNGEKIEINIDNYGYLGLANSLKSYDKNEEWVKNSFTQNYFKDYLVNDIKSNIIDIFNPLKLEIKNKNLYFRDYINTPHNSSEIPSSDVADLSFLNPHRLKFIIINVDNMVKHKISYNPLHTMAEDIFLTREIFKKNLKTCQISLNITAPKDTRRPITCLTITCD